MFLWLVKFELLGLKLRIAQSRETLRSWNSQSFQTSVTTHFFLRLLLHHRYFHR